MSLSILFCIFKADAQQADSLFKLLPADFQNEIQQKHRQARRFRALGYLGIGTSLLGPAFVQSRNSSSAAPTLIAGAALGGSVWSFNKAFREQIEANQLEWQAKIRFAPTDSLARLQAQQAFDYFTKKAMTSQRIGYAKSGIAALLIGGGVSALSQQPNQPGDVLNISIGAGLLLLGGLAGLSSVSSFHHARMYRMAAVSMLEAAGASSLYTRPMQVQWAFPLQKNKGHLHEMAF